MKSRSTVFNVILLLFFLGADPAPFGTQSMNTQSPSNSFTDQEQSPSRREYCCMVQAKGLTKEGILACFQSYESLDGIRVFTRTEYFRSTDEMEAHFETETKSLAELIERSDIKSAKGDLNGHRIVGKHLPNGEGIETYSIMLNEEDSKIKYIESTSLVHILDFEKQFSNSFPNLRNHLPADK